MAKPDRNAAAAPDLLVAAFALIAEDGWDGLSFAVLARRTGVPVAEVYRQLPTRGAVLRLLNRRIDQVMLEVDEAELVGLPPRDRAFELLMRRLEALVPFRPGLERLPRVARRDPCVVLLTRCRLDRSLAWLQDVAGLRRHGLRARVARRALGAAYLRTLRVWFEDDATDLGRTMAELDKQLRRVQAVAGLREPRAGRAPAGEAPQPA
jgi:AcrR family transcriptional regulator